METTNAFWVPLECVNKAGLKTKAFLCVKICPEMEEAFCISGSHLFSDSLKKPWMPCHRSKVVSHKYAPLAHKPPRSPPCIFSAKYCWGIFFPRISSPSIHTYVAVPCRNQAIAYFWLQTASMRYVLLAVIVCLFHDCCLFELQITTYIYTSYYAGCFPITTVFVRSDAALKLSLHLRTCWTKQSPLSNISRA